MNNQEIVQKLWNLCNVLRDDGITYSEYVTELTYILFLKMAKETGAEKNIPEGYRWENLATYSGTTLKNFYVDLLKYLGENGAGLVKKIYQGAKSNIEKPANLEKIISAIDALDWYSAREEGLGNLYEGLLEKNANEKKSGAGQYFTPRPLIDCIVRLMKPQAGELCNDPACGTFGFMIAAAQYVRAHTDDFFDLTPDQQIFETEKAFTGCELVRDTHRLALMNALLHDLHGEIILGDTLSSIGQKMKDFDLVLSNPPFGTKKGGERPTRDDLTFITLNKQLNFLQHIYRSLQVGGRATVILPDNVLFADGDGAHIRADLMDKCNLHTVLRLPTGIFYAQGVKTNVLFFTRGAGDYDNTKEVWFYDLRTNMQSFSKTAPLTKETFAAFESAFDAKDRRAVVDERFNVFTRAQIAEKNNSLDLGLIRDESVADVEETPDLIDAAEEIISQLEDAAAIVQSVVDELKACGLKKNSAPPDDWQLTKLGEVCNFERGITFPAAAKENNLTEKNIPCIRTANVQEKFNTTDLIYVDKSFTKNNSSKLLKVGDIIFSSANSRELVGKTCYVNSLPFEMTFGGFVTVIRTKNFLSKYIFYFLRREFLFGKFMSESTQTVNIANINTSKLANFEIPLPPLAEQKRIVQRIDFLFEKLDTAANALKSILRRVELFNIYLLKDALEGDLTSKFRAYSGISKDDWQEKTLGEICRFIGGGTPNKKIAEYWNGNICWASVKDIKGDYLVDTVDKISEQGLNNSSANLCEVDDLILITRIEPGKTIVSKIITAINQDLKIVKSSLPSKFLHYFFQTVKNEIEFLSSGSTVKGITIEKLNKFPINLPPLAEQKEIARLLDSFISKENFAQDAAEKILRQIDALKKNILARAFRGELGTNNPSESACEVLNTKLEELN